MHRLTTQRKKIIDIVKMQGHSTLNEISQILVSQGEEIALSTVYRSLKSLEDMNLVKRIPSKYGQDFYEYFDQEKHDHFICLKCHKIYDIPKKTKKNPSLDGNGNLINEAITTYYGVCKKCLEK